MRQTSFETVTVLDPPRVLRQGNPGPLQRLPAQSLAFTWLTPSALSLHRVAFARVRCGRVAGEKEQAYRDHFRAKIRSEFIPYAEVADSEGKIPGLGPPDDRRSEWAVAIPWAGLSIIAEKFARGCEFKLRGRLVTEPYGLRTSVQESDVIPGPWASAIKRYDFGPGCKIQRLFAREDHNVVRYWISLWGSLCLHVKIDVESELRKADALARRPPGNRILGGPPTDADSALLADGNSDRARWHT